MQSDSYVGLSAQLALQRRLDTLANNVANSSTAGFRAEEISFEQILSTAGNEPVSFVSRGATHLSTKTGDLVQTGNPFDVAVRGQSWLAVQTPTGTTYTRDGRLQMTDDGVLTNVSGQPILDAGGAALQLDPNAGAPLIGKDGTVSQNGRTVGALGLFRMPSGANLTRGEGASVKSDLTPTPELEFVSNGVVQGFTEKSNVNPVNEITRLIAVQRTFEAVTNALQESENSREDALKVLAG